MSYDHRDRLPIMGRYGQPDSAIEGSHLDVAISRLGALITEDQLLEWALQGHMFHAQQGDATTQLDFAETAYDEDQPQFALRVPAGKIVIPTSLIVTLEDAAGTDTLLAWSRTTNDIGDGTSTAATISNMRSDIPFTSGCTARSLYTANATAATGLIEVVRWMDAFVQAAGTINRFAWDIRTAGAIPILVGPATLQMHLVATGTAPQGFGEYTWIELDTPRIIVAA